MSVTATLPTNTLCQIYLEHFSQACIHYCVIIRLDPDFAVTIKVACNAVIVIWIKHTTTPSLLQINLFKFWVLQYSSSDDHCAAREAGKTPINIARCDEFAITSGNI